MKKHFLVGIILICMFMCSCSKPSTEFDINTEITVSNSDNALDSETLKVSETSIESTLTSEILETSVFTVSNEVYKMLTFDIDVEAFDLVYSQEQLSDFINNHYVKDEWINELEKLGILKSRYASAYCINDYVVIQYFDVLVDDDGYGFVGMHQPPAYYIIFNNDDVFTFFYPTNSCGGPWFYISEDVLYIYEKAFSSLVCISLTSYNIKTGEMIEQLHVTYDWAGINYFYKNGGDPNEFVTWYSTINEISNMPELQEYMLNISDTWYN
ncbi:MAG: hypothetical protein NC395_07465 [Prevotella sp.]|nr:hypothetical protein [Prevotella sp.]